MALVNHQEIEPVGRELIQPPNQRLDAGDVGQAGKVDPLLGGDGRGVDAFHRQPGAGLIQQLAPMDQDADAAGAGHHAGADVAEDRGLPPAGRQLIQHGAMAGAEGVAYCGDAFLLEGVEAGHSSPDWGRELSLSSHLSPGWGRGVISNHLSATPVLRLHCLAQAVLSVPTAESRKPPEYSTRVNARNPRTAFSGSGSGSGSGANPKPQFGHLSSVLS